VFFRTGFRLPLWTALVVVAAAFVVRASLRGFDFRPDLPSDALVLLLLIVVVALVGFVRADDARRDRDAGDDSPDDERGPDS
jgi:hypothetical protein